MTFNYWLGPDGKLHDAGADIGSHNTWAKEHLIQTRGQDWWNDFMMSDCPSPRIGCSTRRDG